MVLSTVFGPCHFPVGYFSCVSDLRVRPNRVFGTGEVSWDEAVFEVLRLVPAAGAIYSKVIHSASGSFPGRPPCGISVQSQ